MDIFTPKRIVTGVAVLLVGGVVTLFVVVGRSERDRNLAEARTAVEHREFERALSILEAHLRTNSDDKDALLLAAQTARRSHVYARADKFLRNYVQQGGAPEEVLREERRTKAQSGDKEVADALLLACKQTPGDPSNFFDLEAIVQGCLPPLDEIEAVRGRVEDGPDLHRAFQAVDALLQTPMETPNRAEALFWSGRIHNIGMRYERGVQDLRQAVELAPTHFGARRYLANTIVRASPDEALAHLTILSMQRPGDVSTLFALASLHRSLGQTAEAVRILDELLHDRPGNHQLLLERALVDLDLGRPANAETLLRRALVEAPDHRAILFALSTSLRAQNRTEEADGVLKRCIELDAKGKQMQPGVKPK